MPRLAAIASIARMRSSFESGVRMSQITATALWTGVFWDVVAGALMELDLIARC
jgi:hypothetical protein